MKNEQEMLNLFRVEELEKRYELRAWIKGASVKAIVDFDGNVRIEGGLDL